MEFDMVLLPFLEGERMDSPRKESFLHSGERQVPGWVLSNPGNFVCENTPVLDAHLQARREDAAYEELCKLYVALTRAKSAVCAITTALPEKKGSAGSDDSGANFPILFAATLGDEKPEKPNTSPLWADGQRDWFENFPKTTSLSAADLASGGDTSNAAAAPALPTRRIWERLRPSGDGHFSIPAESLFSRGTRGAEAGRAIHTLLAGIGFLENGAVPFSDAEDALSENAVLATAFRSPEFRAVFTAPEPGAVLWRERAFDVILGEAWVSGIFDRVVIGAKTAWLWDFKTDANAIPDSLLERHGGQMRLYRQALQKLTGFPLAQIHAAIVHVPSGGVLVL
jgi:ATP-dependent exoDNAse (exonuclease V) beta subunit